jgi:hypothetical protein
VKNPEDASPTTPQPNISAPLLVADRKSTFQLGHGKSERIWWVWAWWGFFGPKTGPQHDKAEPGFRKLVFGFYNRSVTRNRLTLFLKIP